jgi:perosamine synthetase
MNAKLAMFGGAPTVRPEYRRLEWPVVTQADKGAVLRVLDSGKFTVGAKNEQEISGWKTNGPRSATPAMRSQ